MSGNENSGKPRLFQKTINVRIRKDINDKLEILREEMSHFTISETIRYILTMYFKNKGE